MNKKDRVGWALIGVFALLVLVGVFGSGSQLEKELLLYGIFIAAFAWTVNVIGRWLGRW